MDLKLGEIGRAGFPRNIRITLSGLAVNHAGVSVKIGGVGGDNRELTGNCGSADLEVPQEPRSSHLIESVRTSPGYLEALTFPNAYSKSPRLFSWGDKRRGSR